MATENMMYSNDNVSVIYRPSQDDYSIALKLTTDQKHARLFIDQRVLEEFSRNDVNHLSRKLSMVGPDYDLSRTDVERLHGALVRAMQEYERQVKDFRKKEDL